MTFKEAIKTELDRRAASDSLFAASYAKEKKSIDECCEYILQEVGKMKREGNCLALADEEVYSLAVHYYDEDDIVLDKNKPQPKPEVKFTPASPKPQPKKPAPKEPTLFDIYGSKDTTTERG